MAGTFECLLASERGVTYYTSTNNDKVNTWILIVELDVLGEEIVGSSDALIARSLYVLFVKKRKGEIVSLCMP